jgi:Ca-activated chloride channel homolog
MKTIARILWMGMLPILALGCSPAGDMFPHIGTASRVRMAAPSLSAESADAMPSPFNTEQYDVIRESGFKSALREPLSTFSIDVDTASYANVRRFLRENRMPPPDAVRIEEMVNYFSYDYPEPSGDAPFSVTVEAAGCPWNAARRLVHIGIRGKSVPAEDIPPMNLVFLLDVSGSMNSPNKLPLLRKAFGLLAEQLRSEDRVAIAVYAGAAGVVLPPTPGDEKETIMDAIRGLRASGSTAGGEGIRLAYRLAEEHFVPKGNNRVILATDGDFNVGVSSDGELVRLVEEKRDSGIFLTVLGFGTGNLKDAKMEKLARAGNGNYAYIDSVLEARKVLVREMGATLLTIARDVKIQVEFNPARIEAYRLIGYENRLLAPEDFNDDRKDAGELGAGHTVTALYELIPAGSGEKIPGVDDLKYQTRPEIAPNAADSGEIMTVKLRYKPPGEGAGRRIAVPMADSGTDWRDASENYRFSAAVAGFGMLLRRSEYRGGLDYPMVLRMARDARGKDENGYRAEFIRLAETAEMLEERGK